MKTSSKLSLSTAMLALLLGAGHVSADAIQSSQRHEWHPSLEQGLDRDRATYRALILEARRAEEEAMRRGAGLDRARAERRAEKLAERRQQQYH